jgi:hypothetical protein
LATEPLHAYVDAIMVDAIMVDAIIEDKKLKTGS